MKKNMNNQENKCIKLQEDYQKLEKSKGEFDVMLEEIQGQKKEMGKNMMKIKDDIQKAKLKKREIKNKMIEIQEQMDQVIKGVYEGVEKKISLNEQIKYWNQFYQDYEIKDEKGKICQVPKNLHLTPEALAQAKQDMEKFGFDMILIIPEGIRPIDLLNNDKLLTFKENEFDEEGNKKKIENKRYIDSDIPADILNTSISQTQIILLTESPAVYQDENWKEEWNDEDGPTFLEVQKKEKDLKIEGLDIPSFIFFHRNYYDKHNKTHSHNWGEDNATWLTKTATNGQCAWACWYPDLARLEFSWCMSEVCNSALGAVFSRSSETMKKKK